VFGESTTAVQGQIARIYGKTDLHPQAEFHFLARDTLPHKFQLKCRYNILYSVVHNLSIENGLIIIILCVISPFLSFVSHSQQVGVILFLVLGCGVCNQPYYHSLASAARLWHFNLISLYSNGYDTPKILFLEKYRALDFFLNKLKLPNSTGNPATEPIRSIPKPPSEALASDLSPFLCQSVWQILRTIRSAGFAP
jgi:hypothetical protein